MNRKKKKKEKENQKESFSAVKAAQYIKNLLKRGKNVTNEDNAVEHFYQYETAPQNKHSSYSRAEWISFAAAGTVLVHICLLISRYVFCLFHLQKVVISNNPFYIAAAGILPFIGWVAATNTNYWAFHQRKRLFFYGCCLNLLASLLQPVYTLCWKAAVPIVSKVKVNPLLTERMILFLAQIVITVGMALVLSLLYSIGEPLFRNPGLKREIELFKWQHVWDTRANREYCYDITSIKSLESGKALRIKENERFLQTAINGPSGTGKTSAIFENVICDDMDQKVKNREKRQEAMMQMLQEGRAVLKGPLKEFRESAVTAAGRTKAEKKRNEKELEKIKSKFPDCGMTIVAPNASLFEDIIRLGEARNIKINIMDPLYRYDGVKNVSINPFYIPFNLAEEERVNRISEVSSIFSDVLIATNQMNGQSDVYFTDISLSVSSNISAVVMLAKNLDGQQAYIDDVQECIGNFENLRPYVEKIETYYDISVAAAEAPKKQGMAAVYTVEDAAAAESSLKGSRKKGKKNPYYHQLLFVKQELLGAGAEKLYDQARGLRNLIDKILQDVRIKKKLSADDDERIDFDKMLSENEITCVNTAIELGKNISSSFGLFFILLQRASVLRRPKETRTPHFIWIDEATQYMHPVYEDMIALYRQYRAAVVITLQSLTQTQKSPATAYLKNVFLGAGTHIVFGRLSPDEMELYSKMAGITREEQEQKSITENDIFSSNPNYTQASRFTPTIANNLEGGDLRNLDFLELTLFTVNGGRVLPGQFGRVFFIGREKFDKKRMKIFLWEKAAPEAFREMESAALPNENAGMEWKDAVPQSEVQEILTKAEEKREKIGAADEEKQMSLAEIFGVPQAAGEKKEDGEDVSLEDAGQEAFRDEKTGALNKAALQQFLNQFVRRGDTEGLCIIFADADGLRQVKQNRNSENSNRMVKKTAGILQELFKDNVYRYSGEQFVIALEGVSETVVRRKIEAARKRFYQETQRDLSGAVYFVAMGYAVGSGNLSVKQLLALADKAVETNQRNMESKKRAAAELQGRAE